MEAHAEKSDMCRMVQIKNSHNSQPLAYRDDELKTSKIVMPDEHGVGIKYMIRIVEKYEGEYVIQNNEEEFYFSIIIPIRRLHSV